MNKSLILGASALVLAACGSNPPKPVIPQPKTVVHEGKELVFSGEYWQKKKDLTVFVNGDPVMRGSFPPLTPTLNIKADYNGVAVGAYCYFGSVLGSEGGAIGIVAGIVQSQRSKSGDKCELKIDDKIVDNLYF